MEAILYAQHLTTLVCGTSKKKKRQVLFRGKIRGFEIRQG
jgi:hypothetical protein